MVQVETQQLSPGGWQTSQRHFLKINPALQWVRLSLKYHRYLVLRRVSLDADIYTNTGCPEHGRCGYGTGYYNGCFRPIHAGRVRKLLQRGVAEHLQPLLDGVQRCSDRHLDAGNQQTSRRNYRNDPATTFMDDFIGLGIEI